MNLTLLAHFAFGSALIASPSPQVHEEIVDTTLVAPSGVGLFAETIVGDEILGLRYAVLQSSQVTVPARLVSIRLGADGAWTITQEVPVSGNVQHVHRLSADEAVVGTPNDSFGGQPVYPNGSLQFMKRSAAGQWSIVGSTLGSEQAKVVASDNSRFVVFETASSSIPQQLVYSIYKRDPFGAWLYEGFCKPLDKFPVLGPSESIVGNPQNVALFSDRVLIGGRSGAANIHRVYEFQKTPSGAWLQVGVIQRLDHVAFSAFGSAVALTDTMAIIGAPASGFYAPNSGSVHIYERDALGQWFESQVLYDPELGSNAWFGLMIDLRADSLVIAGKYKAHRFYKDTSGKWTLHASYAVSNVGPYLGLFGLGVDASRTVFNSVVALPPGSQPPVANAIKMIEHSPLDGDVEELSLAAAGEQSLLARFGSAWGSQPYFCLGSGSGTAPGIQVSPGLQLALNYDNYLEACLLGSAPLVNQLGTFGANGTALITFDLPSGLSASLQGLELNHVVLAARNLGSFEEPNWYVKLSNPVSITLVP